MDRDRLEEYGLSESDVEEIRTQEQRQFEFFLRTTGGAAAALWLVLTILVYTHSFRQAPFLGLATAPLLALLGVAIGALPIAVACGLGILVLYPRHPKAAALERYQAATAHVRQCDVCVLARGDHGVKADVRYCARCDAWLCPECRNRYDLRAIAALRAMGDRGGGRDRVAATGSSRPR